MTRALPPLFFAILGISTAAAEELLSTPEALIARPKSLELNTPYVPPPGDPLEHHTAGFAKIMCSAVFITGLDPEFAAENVGYFTSPYAERAKVSKPAIDRANREVHIRLPSGVTRTAKYLGSHCAFAGLAQAKNYRRFFREAFEQEFYLRKLAKHNVIPTSACRRRRCRERTLG